MLLRIVAVLTLALIGAPSVTFAQSMPAAATAPQAPSQAQMQSALAAANVDLRQKRKLKPMFETYKSQIANAPDQQSKSNATKQLMDSMATVLSPAQQAAFKQSLMNQMGSAH